MRGLSLYLFESKDYKISFRDKINEKLNLKSEIRGQLLIAFQS